MSGKKGPMDPDRYQMVDLKRRLTKLEKAYDRQILRYQRLMERIHAIEVWSSAPYLRDEKEDKQG